MIRHDRSGRHGDESDVYSLYLTDVAEHELLTHEEEVALAKRIEAGDQDARRELIERNLRLVISVARRFQGRGLPLADLVQEGNLGLLKAVDKFDWRRGFRFSTYAHWWIRQGVGRGVQDHGRTIRLPIHLQEELGWWRRAEDTGDPYPTEDAERLRCWALEPLSLSTPVGDEDGAELGDTLADHRGLDPADVEDYDQLWAAIDSLPERTQRIIRERFGLDSGVVRSLKAVGDGLEQPVSRERIRQIERESLRLLRVALKADGDGPGEAA